MNKTEIKTQLGSTEFLGQMKRLSEMRSSFTYCLSFCYFNSARDGVSVENNFFLRMIDDILQSVVSIEALAKEGIVNTCRRELRYLTELAIKSQVIANGKSEKTFDEQVSEYEKLLNSSNINPINSLSFLLLGPQYQDEFKTEVKRVYGYLSNYTHSTAHQIRERLIRVEEGRSIGYEGLKELTELNDDIERVLAIVLVMIFHSIAQYIVGDFLVDEDGGSVDWYFNRSKYIALVDEHFDYKAERKFRVAALKKERLEKVKF